jgi:hypothetical protein
MPIEIRDKKYYKEYKIDYLKWKEDLMNLKIFNDKRIQKKYLDTWMDVLMKSDKASIDFFSKPQNQFLYDKERNEAPEIFQQILVYASNTVYVHFRVSRIIQVLEQLGFGEKDTDSVDLKIFIEKKTIEWTETENDSEIKNTPIFLAPFTIGANIHYVAIDGNHRITDAVKRNIRKLNCLYLNPQALVDNNLFCTDFDKLLYVFHNEVIWLGSNSRMTKNVQDDIEILKETFFMSGKVHVWGEN